MEDFQKINSSLSEKCVSIFYFHFLLSARSKENNKDYKFSSPTKEMKLATKRLIIRDLKLRDAKDIVENVNDLEVSKYLVRVPFPCKLKDATEFINHSRKESKNKPRKNYEFGIELKSEKKIIGAIGLYRVDKFQGTAGIGYWLGKKYWGQGIMSEAFAAVLNFAFEKLNLRRINIEVFVENEASNNLIKKFCFKYEGLRKEFVRSKATGRIHDENIYGLLKSEYNRS